MATAALVIVLSVYNGIGEVTQSLFNLFDPQLTIRPAEGKSFNTEDIDYQAICALPQVEAVSQVVEENAWVTYRQNEAIVTLRGVDGQYAAVSGLDTAIYEGEYMLLDTARELNYLLLGAELYYQLGLNSMIMRPVAVNIPKRGRSIGYSFEEAFNTGYAYPAGNFYIQKDIDSRYVVADIDFVRQLLDYSPSEVSSLSLSLRDGYSVAAAQRALQQILPEGRFTVLDRYQQQPIYYKIFRSERLGIILILSLIVLISTLNLVASLSLLILDKRRDIFTLRSLGMPQRRLYQTFFLEGMLITMVGVAVGLTAGFVLCALQQHFGLIRMGGGDFVVSAFPVAMHGTDFLLTFFLVGGISSLSVALTVRRGLRSTRQKASPR